MWSWFACVADPTTDLDGTDAVTSDLVESSSPTGDTSPPDPDAPPEFSTPPSLRPNETIGLATWVTAVTRAPASLRIEVEAGERRWTQHSPLATDHEVAVVGLLIDADTPIRVTAVDEAGAESDTVTLVGHAPPLPSNLVPPFVTFAEPDRMEPGYTQVTDGQYTVLFGADGEVVWYSDLGGVNEVFLQDDHLWFNADRRVVVEMDVAGRVFRRFATSMAPIEPDQVDVPLTALHHDIEPMPNGHLLVLDAERRRLPYFTAEDPAAPLVEQWVVGDVPTELDMDGNVVRRWPMLDLLDTGRIGYDSVRGDFWFDFGPWEDEKSRDWEHANALSYDPATDLALVSLRHQDAVVAFSWTTGEIAWIVAPEENWHEPWASKVLRPSVPGRIPYHQHAARFLPNGNVLLFDNGNYRASPPDKKRTEDLRSRAFEFRPDPASGTYEVVWEWGEERRPPLSVTSHGDADRLPLTGNTLIDFGNPSDTVPRLIELSPTDEVVWDAAMQHQGHWYRATRITGWFPWESTN